MISKEEVQLEGKSGPASPTLKSFEQKCSARRLRTSASSRTSRRRLSTWRKAVSGATNLSPSSRRSERKGLKTEWRSAASSSPKALAPAARCPQKAAPAAPSALRPQPPEGPAAFSGVAAVRSNLERLRSTPWRWACASMPARRGCPTRGGPSCLTLVTPRTRDIWAVAPRASIAPEARLGLEMLKRSSPNSTPPYTQCFFEPMPASASTILPSCTETWEWQRSFHSWGSTSDLAGPGWPARLSQASCTSTFPSTRNLASTEAFASSRRW
mmetsp:Transcript_31034/g.84143  ORF Transcript_31034/g.84143 Transcript_31034/m.84143 type:complete len:270 (-) Transcript_31034:1199-2008(-)